MIRLILALLVLSVPAFSQTLTVVKKQGDPIIFSWDYADVGQTGFVLKSNTVGDAAPYIAVPVSIPAAARTVTIPANFPSGQNTLFFRLAAIGDAGESPLSDPPPCEVKRGIGPPGNVKVK